MKKEFTIRRKSEREVFRAYVEMLKPFLKGLRSRECDVFAEILYQYSLRKNIQSKRDRFALVLNGDGREIIADTLNMSQATLRNAVSSLRKKGLLKDDNTIADVYLLSLQENSVGLSFVFKVGE